MKNCFLFPGQGAQYPGMGKDLYEASQNVKDLFAKADTVTGRDLKALLFEGTVEDLKKTENTQVAITLINLAIRRYLEELGITSKGAAGFSLGEFSAMVDTGILTEEQVLPLVIERGEIMAKVAATSPALADGCGMAAVIGMSSEDVEKAVAGREDVFPANYNSPVQTVVSGTAAGIDWAAKALKEAGARRVIPLKVSGPFHTPLLEEAKKAFGEYLSSLDFKDPAKPLYSNVTGGMVKEGKEARKLSALQIVSPVKWVAIQNNIVSDGFEACIEVGPGKVLSGLWKNIKSDITCYPTDKKEAIDAVAGELK
ncbi:MAG: malonyl CoA-ACP transacylase [Spirochaetes bacterium]|nr:MAG: malonyl CoA-ACP transacylase [Spirochaetota bacterium]